MLQRFLFNGIAWVKLAIFVGMTALASHVFATDVAGSVSFVIGEASVIDIDGKQHPVARGDKVNVGQILVTGASGHVHMTMIDRAFLSVRPDSRLVIQDYHYDIDTPANNRIKFVLEKGVARSITGRAGEASKENYRLNTPLAAIGIRGTDFVVMVNEDVTRVQVQSGSVVLAPFGEGCLSTTYGPCKSSSMRVLNAAMQNAYLELRARSEVPVLVPGEKALETPNAVAPPRPEEPRAINGDKQIKAGISMDAGQAARDAAADSIKAKVDVAAISSNAGVLAAASTKVSASEPLPVPVLQPAVVAETVPVVTPPAAAQFWWGRWTHYIKIGEEAHTIDAAWDNQNPKRQVLYGNAVFGMFGATGEVALPSTGTAKFLLADSEAAFMDGNKIVATGQVGNASLNLDFLAKRFDTSLSVSGNGATPVNVQSGGVVTWQGQLRSDTNPNGTIVNGALSPDTSQAGYVFEKPLSGATSVVGATRWTR